MKKKLIVFGIILGGLLCFCACDKETKEEETTIKVEAETTTAPRNKTKISQLYIELAEGIEYYEGATFNKNDFYIYAMLETGELCPIIADCDYVQDQPLELGDNIVTFSYNDNKFINTVSGDLVVATGEVFSIQYTINVMPIYVPEPEPEPAPAPVLASLVFMTPEMTADEGEKYYIQGVPNINQYAIGMPSGCETVSMTQILNYYGIGTDPIQFSYYVPQDYYCYDCNIAFIGSVFDDRSFGCNAPVITNATNNYLQTIGSGLRAVNISGMGVEAVYNQVKAGNPVSIWASDKFNEPYWVDYRVFSWLAPEHCMTLIGVSDKYVYFSDPIYGYTQIDKGLFERIFAIFGSQAVILQ